MTIGVEDKACMIFESLSCHFSDGHVSYTAFHGNHKFVITLGDCRFKVRFSEDTLAKQNVDALQRTMHAVVRQVRATSSARSLGNAA